MKYRVNFPDGRFCVDAANNRWLLPGAVFEAPESVVEPFRSLVERCSDNTPVLPQNVIRAGAANAEPHQKIGTKKAPWDLKSKEKVEEKAAKKEEPEEAIEEIAPDAKPISPLEKLRKRAQATSHKEAYAVPPNDRAME